MGAAVESCLHLFHLGYYNITTGNVMTLSGDPHLCKLRSHKLRTLAAETAPPTTDWYFYADSPHSLPRSQLQWITWATAGDGCEMGGGNYVLAVASSCLSSPWAYCHQRLRTRDPGSVLSCAMYDCGSMVELGRCFYDLADRSILSYLASGVSYGCCWRSSRH